MIESVDLSRKIIISFNIHEGSGDGRTYEELQSALINLKVLLGLPICGENVRKFEQKENIKEWSDGLKIDWSDK